MWLTAWSGEEVNENGEMDIAVRNKYLGVYSALGVGQGESSFPLDILTFLFSEFTGHCMIYVTGLCSTIP